MKSLRISLINKGTNEIKIAINQSFNVKENTLNTVDKSGTEIIII